MKPAQLILCSLAATLLAVVGPARGQTAPALDSEPAAAQPAPPPAPAPAAPAPSELPPPPPPKAGPPPPPEGKMVLSQPVLAPAKDRRGYHVHDGFYLRMGAGLGGGRASVSTDSNSSPNFRVGGAGLALNLWIGGTPWKGIAIGGLIALQGMRESETRVEGDNTGEGMDGAVAIIGPFIDAFPDPQRGLHFGGSLGLANFGAQADNHVLEDDFNVTDYNAGGLGLSAWVGYMGFVGPEWSLGGMLQLTSGITAKSDADDVKRQATFGTFNISFTALYH